MARNLCHEHHQKSMLVLTNLELLRFRGDIEGTRGNLRSSIETFHKGRALYMEEHSLMAKLTPSLVPSYALVKCLIELGLCGKLIHSATCRLPGETEEEIMKRLQRANHDASLSTDEQALHMTIAALLGAASLLKGVSDAKKKEVLDMSRVHIQRCEAICTLPQTERHNPITWKIQYTDLVQGVALLLLNCGDAEAALVEQRKMVAVLRELTATLHARQNLKKALMNFATMIRAVGTKRLSGDESRLIDQFEEDTEFVQQLSAEEQAEALQARSELLQLLPENARDCPICMEPIQVQGWSFWVQGCAMHVLHSACAKQWMQSRKHHQTCPVCRDDT
mmetsp:Transcript_51941/g.105776  ORF Transcript_51941/g.105776 Transcript_51941/m.105776 type:complete len:336 (-) Transcript_51941:82-1089(-)